MAVDKSLWAPLVILGFYLWGGMRKLAAGTTNLQHNRLHSASCAAVGLYRRSRKRVTSITILGRTPHDEDACLLKIAHFWNIVAGAVRISTVAHRSHSHGDGQSIGWM
jgi:hypothetical protein